MQTPIIAQEQIRDAVKKILDHFKAEYGSMIFIPLGVWEKTPDKIAPGLTEDIQKYLIHQEGEKTYLVVKDANLEVVFNNFVDSFFSSLNFLAKGVMKALGMKMQWSDFKSQMKKNKIEKPETYEKWKNNIQIILVTIFQETANQLQDPILTNGEAIFNNLDEAFNSLEIFQ